MGIGEWSDIAYSNIISFPINFAELFFLLTRPVLRSACVLPIICIPRALFTLVSVKCDFLSETSSNTFASA